MYEKFINNGIIDCREMEGVKHNLDFDQHTLNAETNLICMKKVEYMYNLEFVSGYEFQYFNKYGRFLSLYLMRANSEVEEEQFIERLKFSTFLRGFCWQRDDSKVVEDYTAAFVRMPN